MIRLGNSRHRHTFCHTPHILQRLHFTVLVDSFVIGFKIVEHNGKEEAVAGGRETVYIVAVNVPHTHTHTRTPPPALIVFSWQ